MSSGDLAPQDSFAQTGTVDWVRLGGGMAAQSYRVLARLANHGVDEYTIRIGSLMGQKLPLGPVGEKYMREATSNLGFYQKLNESLLFGMGPKSVPKMLENSVEGLALLATASALSEVYVEEVAAEVLHELLLHLEPPSELTPSLLTWSRLVKGCAGTLAKTSFGIKAETFMSLHPSETSLFPTRMPKGYDHDNNKWRSRSHAKDIAKALLTMGEISRGKLASVIIIGGGDVGFLAAVAELLFDLEIVIIGNQNQELYRTSIPGSTAHVRFEFRNRINQSPSEDVDVLTLQYPKKVFRVELDDVSDILFANNSNEVMKVSGRLEWNHCLSSAFGYAFETLMGRKEMFGHILGCAGRIFHAVARAEQGVSLRSRKNWIYYRDAGSGIGFVQNLLFWFPELKIIEPMIRRAAAYTLPDARANYESNICNLATTCSCLYCDSTREEHPRTGYCLVALAETILKTALILSNVSIEPGLNPMRIGFERLYEGQIENRPHDQDSCEQRERDLGPIVWVIEPAEEDDDLHPVDNRVRLMMEGALGLFTFIRGLEDSITCALASGGICAYWKILEGLSTYDDLGYALGRIHIIPGRIEWNGIAFDRIQDWYDHSSEAFNMRPDAIDLKEMEFSEPSLKIEQTLHSLRLAYCLTNAKKNTLHIPPTWLLTTAIGAHGWFRCQKRQGCRRGNTAFGNTLQREICAHRGEDVILYQVPNDRTLCATVAFELLFNDFCVIVNDNCTTCALDLAVAEVETQDQLIIVSHR